MGVASGCCLPVNPKIPTWQIPSSHTIPNPKWTKRALKIPNQSSSWPWNCCTHTFGRHCLQVLWFGLFQFGSLEPKLRNLPQITQKWHQRGGRPGCVMKISGKWILVVEKWWKVPWRPRSATAAILDACCVLRCVSTKERDAWQTGCEERPTGACRLSTDILDKLSRHNFPDYAGRKLQFGTGPQTSQPALLPWGERIVWFTRSANLGRSPVGQGSG